MGMKPSTQANAGLIESFNNSALDMIREVHDKIPVIQDLNNQLSILGEVDVSGLSHNNLLNRNVANAHTIASITGLTEALAVVGSGYDDTAITARVEDLETGKVDAILGYGLSENNYSNSDKAHVSTITGKANVLHSHFASDITDLSSLLANKQNTLVSGTTLKTINGFSLLGSGDIAIVGGGNGTTDHSLLTNRNIVDAHPISSITNLQLTLDGKASNSLVTTSANGLMSNTDKVKLEGIASNATANSSDATLVNRANHTGTQAISTINSLQTVLDSKASTAIATTTVNGLLDFNDKVKLNSVAANATANSSDATLLNRANHTGTQGINTVTGLQTALDGKVTDTAYIKRIHVGTTAPADTTMLWLDTN